MQFSIDEYTPINIIHVNVRSELHGQDHVTAIDIKASLTCSNKVLAQFDPELLTMLYAPAQGATGAQGTLEGVDPVSDLPRLRSSLLGPLKLKKEYTGYTTTIQHGIDETTALVLSDCKVNNFALDAKEGGSVVLHFRIQSRGLEPLVLGDVCSKTGQEVKAMVVAPKAEEVQQSLGDNVVSIEAAKSTEKTPEQALADSVGGAEQAQ